MIKSTVFAMPSYPLDIHTSSEMIVIYTLCNSSRGIKSNQEPTLNEVYLHIYKKRPDVFTNHHIHSQHYHQFAFVDGVSFGV